MKSLLALIGPVISRPHLLPLALYHLITLLSSACVITGKQRFNLTSLETFIWWLLTLMRPLFLVGNTHLAPNCLIMMPPSAVTCAVISAPSSMLKALSIGHQLSLIAIPTFGTTPAAMEAMKIAMVLSLIMCITRTVPAGQTKSGWHPQIIFTATFLSETTPLWH